MNSCKHCFAIALDISDSIFIMLLVLTKRFPSLFISYLRETCRCNLRRRFSAFFTSFALLMFFFSRPSEHTANSLMPASIPNDISVSSAQTDNQQTAVLFCQKAHRDSAPICLLLTAIHLPASECPHVLQVLLQYSEILFYPVHRRKS